MFIARHLATHPAPLERHVNYDLKPHCAPRERGGKYKREAINILLLRSKDLKYVSAAVKSRAVQISPCLTITNVDFTLQLEPKTLCKTSLLTKEFEHHYASQRL
jgi:hypothetical protein